MNSLRVTFISRALDFMTGGVYGRGDGPVYETVCFVYETALENCIIETKECINNGGVAVTCSGKLKYNWLRVAGEKSQSENSFSNGCFWQKKAKLLHML
jgi:hypothetical protein